MSTFKVGDRVVVQEASAFALVAPLEGCRVCGKEADFSCSSCKRVRYCGRDHQKGDWKNHKKFCKESKKLDTYGNMHGTVAAISAGKEGRTNVSVNMDLTASSIKVADSCLDKEEPIPESVHRAEVSGGCLVEIEGRTMDTLLGVSRVIAAQHFCFDDSVQSPNDIVGLMDSGSPIDLLKVNTFTSTGWSFWKDGGGYASARGKGVYDLVREYMIENNANLEEAMRDPIFRAAAKALDDPAAAKGWNVRVHSDFWVVGMDEEGTFLVPDSNRSMVFRCLGVRRAIWPMVSNNPGLIMMTATMIPWYGRLVYDGALVPPNGAKFPPLASPALAQRLRDAVEKAKEQGTVIDRLAQLEVPGGSLQGLHDKVATNENSNRPRTKVQGPPTREEKKLVEKLARVPKTPGTFASNPNNFDASSGGFWVFRRHGYTEEENPGHVGFILNGAQAVGPFQCQSLIPESVDILKPLIKYSREAGKRPLLVGVDDADCFERVQFLLRDVDGTNAYYYPPPTAEESAAAMAAGNFRPGF